MPTSKNASSHQVVKELSQCRKIRSHLVSILVGVFIPWISAFAENADSLKTLPDLRQKIEGVLAATHTPGVAIALVGRAGPIWVTGLGIADLAQERPVTEDTRFYLGSTSKTFVALALLKLQQEGRLNLNDTLRALAPEIAFANPWEATDPIRLVHLLEHTTGWDENTPKEASWNPTPEPTRREALVYFNHSLVARWRPGTRFSYTNLGPSVAAYIVEKITGQKFEDYIAQSWFKPLAMKNASYSERTEENIVTATGYGKDHEAVHPGFNLFLRPAGGVRASARDMANYLEFYLNRGSFRGVQLLSERAIDRMEHPKSTYAAAEGLELGYGLNNAASLRGAWVFHGHGGAVPGMLANMLYLPEKDVGYALMINSENGNAMDQLERLLQSYLLRDEIPPKLPTVTASDPAQNIAYSGWYTPITPRNESAAYIERILGLTHLTFENGQLFLRDLANGKVAYSLQAGRFYRRADNAAPVLALIANLTDGTLVQFGGGATYRRIPKQRAILSLVAALATALLMLGSVISAAIWIPRKLFGDLKAEPYMSVRADPLLATFSCVALCGLIWTVSGDSYAHAGGPLWSGRAAVVAYYLAHGAFLSFALGGLIRALHYRHKPISPLVWWHAFSLSLILSVAAVYLVYGGLRSVFTS